VSTSLFCGFTIPKCIVKPQKMINKKKRKKERKKKEIVEKIDER
jgi:hypothetical protein